VISSLKSAEFSLISFYFNCYLHFPGSPASSAAAAQDRNKFQSIIFDEEFKIFSMDISQLFLPEFPGDH